MNKNLVGWGAVIILVVVGGGFWLGNSNKSAVVTTPPSTGLENIPSDISVTAPVIGDSEEVEAVDEKQSVAGEVNQIAIASGNLFYRPDKLSLKKGEPVKLNFTNTGFHTFTIDELGVNEQFSGPSATVEFTPAQAGEFEYYCAVPGHREGGMIGTLTVR